MRTPLPAFSWVFTTLPTECQTFKTSSKELLAPSEEATISHSCSVDRSPLIEEVIHNFLIELLEQAQP
jgi:hypothetical protein